MSTYDDDESGQASSAPIEGYEFIGSATTWRYTSGIEAVTIAGNVYTPLAGLARGTITQASLRDTPTLSVRLPVDTALVQHYGFQTPPRSLRLKVYRYQPAADEYVKEWDGDVTALVPKGTSADVQCPSSLAARLETTVPSGTVRRHCMHALYDARCRVSRSSGSVALGLAFHHETTVLSVSGTDARVVTIADIAAFTDQWFRAGEIVRDSDGERRSIVDQVGPVIKLVAPFRTLANGDAVTIYAGCDHKIDTCNTKFDNALNFGGFANMPKFNPFRVPVRLGDGS